MKERVKEEITMIACCADATRPVVFKIERMDYEYYIFSAKAFNLSEQSSTVG